MIQKPLIILGYLFLTASALAMPHQEPDVSFLSDKAKASLTVIKGLHEQIHAKIEAASDESTEKTWRDLGRSLHETCLIGRGPGPGGHRPAPLTDEKKQEFESKLTSEACSQAISSAQGKLQ